MGCGIAAVLLVAIVVVVIGFAWESANQGASAVDGLRTQNLETGSPGLAVWEVMPRGWVMGERIRVTTDRRWYESRNSGTLYIPKKTWEDTPFPDRRAVTNDLAKAWCSSVHQESFFTVVSFADVRGGDRFASVRCSEVSRKP